MNPKFIDNLHNEIAKEKFLALRRISETLSGYLQALEVANGNIRKAIEENRPAHEIDQLIAAFNRVREDAEEWLYYLTVTREASGFFNSALRADAYKIPPRRKPVGTESGKN